MIIHDVEQRSDEWYALRAGIPTASEFSKLVTSKGKFSTQIETYAKTLAAEKFAGKPVDAWEGNQWTERGRDLEDEALKLYGFSNDCELTRVGFVTNDEGTMGCSPDALVNDHGLVELKCLKAERHIEAMAYFTNYRRPQPSYIAQAQGQMLICERPVCDLLFYHPVLPPFTISVAADAAFHRSILLAVDEVLRQRDDALELINRFAGGMPAHEAAKEAAQVPASVDLSQEKPAF